MKMRPGVRTAAVALCCAAVMAFAAGCGGSGTTLSEPLDPGSYARAVTHWFETNWEDKYVQGKQVVFAEVHNPTQTELLKMQEFADELKTSVLSLRAIIPPAEIARVHRQFAADWAGEIDLLQHMVDAAKAGDWMAFDQAASASMAIMEQDANTLAALGAYVDAHAAD